MRTIVVQRCGLSLLTTLLSLCDGAFIIRSQETDQWATGVTRYAPLRRVMVVSTIFYDETDSVTGAGTMDTDCELLIADATGVWVPIDFEGPKLCVGGALVREANGGEAFFVGIEGNQTIVVNVDNVGSDNPTPGSNYPVLDGKIPVAVDPGNPDDDYIYVAMHGISAQVTESGFGTDRSSTLKGIMNYWERSSDPASLAKETSYHNVPYITKMNPQTGEISWLGVYEAQQGSSTVAAMAYTGFTLIICGSTNGSGDVVGYDDDGDWDGYVAFVNPVTGNIEAQFTDPDTSLSESRGHLRIQSHDQGKNDFIYDMCVMGSESLFVVGTTEGVISGNDQGGAFVVKIDIARRTIAEKVQLSGSNKRGLKIVCSETHVYIGGHVYDGDSTSDDYEQHIFVTAHDAALSEVQWSVEISTSPYFGETRRDQIVDMEVNPAGDVNLLFNSQVLASGINHIVFLDLQRDTGENEIQKGAKAVGAGGIPDDGIEVEPVANDDADQTEVASESQTSSSDEKKKRIVISFSVLIPVLVALGVGIYTIKGRS